MSQNVKLDDGKLLKTRGTVELAIRFGYLSYSGILYVL